MKKIILILCAILFWNTSVLADEYCFIATENGKILRQEGDCTTRYSPESTFKIALSLMGFDSGILQDANNPKWTCKPGDDYFINVCKGPHTPKTWIRDSCLWYSRILTAKLGIEKFQQYVQKFNYGNKKIKGNDALSSSWVSSSLQISPIEQTEFIQGMVNHQFSISVKSYKLTKQIMFIQEFAGGWKIYGKTGNGKKLDKNGLKTELQHGWFVGWIEKNGRTIMFASHIAEDKKQNTFASFRARNSALIKLWYLIDEIEK